MGWNLSGMSVISRVGKNMYFDGEAGAVEFSANDRFVLDGSRLILKTGTYGANSSTYGPESEDFSTITAMGTSGSGTTYFSVLTKDGVKMEFGNTVDSRFMSETGGHVMFWRLNKVRYPDGNYIEFVYSTTTSERDSRLLQIKYTGNDTPGAILAPYNVIEFIYRIRQEESPGTFSDIRTSYEAGSSVLNKYLLDSIAVKAEGVVAKSFRLAYGHDDVNSYLKSVTERGSDNKALNPTIFKYGDKPILNTVSSGSIQATNSITSFSGDYDGDGMPDILSIKGSANSVNSFSTWKRNQSTGAYTLMATQSVPQTSTFRIQNDKIPGVKQQFSSDINGDGLTDVSLFAIQAVTDNTGGNYLYSRIDNILHYISNPGGTSFTAQTQSMPVVGGEGYDILPTSGNFVFQGDFDGDGLTEQVFQLKNTLFNNDLTLFYYDNAAGSYNYTEVMQFTPVNGSIRQDWWEAKEHQIIDFNGDGKQDLALFWDDWVEIFTFDSPTHVRSLYNSSTFPISTPSNVVHFGDFNGDGKMDVLTIEDAMTSVVKGISTGSTFIQSPFPIADHWSVKSTTKNINSYFVLGDFNGDGKSDAYFSWKRFGENSGDGTFFPYTKGVDIYYSNGDGFYNKQVDFEYDILPVSSRPSPSSTYDVPVDLNGDGRSDIVSGGSNVISRIDFFNTSGTDNLLNKVSNGFNHATEWNYKSLAANAALYTKGGTSTYPLNIIQPAALMVTDLKVQNGIGGTSVVQYNYEGLRLHRAGKGFLGFAKVTATDLAMGMKTISENEFNTTYYTAAPKKTASYLTAGNVLLTETTLVNEFVAQGPAADKRFLYRLKSSSENNVFEGRTASLVNNTFDAYGNVTQSTATNSIETVVTDALYEAYPSGTPNKPTTITTTKTRSGQAAFAVTQVMGYNAIGQLTSKTDFDGLAKKVVTGYAYFPLGNLERTTVTPFGDNAPAASSSSAVYDAKGRYPESTTNQLSQVSSATYDAKWGKPLTSTGINGLTTSYQYDAFGRTRIVTPPATTTYDITETYGWDINTAEGTVWYSLVSQPGKPYVKTWYDLLGRERKTETKGFDDQLVTNTQTYNARGNVSVSTQPHKAAEPFVTTTTSYDSYNRPSGIDNGPLGSTTITYAYSSGNLTVTTTAPSGTSSKKTDASGKVIAATDNGGTLNYTYYSHGGLKDVENGGITLTSNEYDVYGRQSKLTDANAGPTQYVYNAVGQLVSQTNANGQTHTMAYNVLGQVTSRVGPEGTTSYLYGTSSSGGESKNQVKQVTGFAPGNQTNYTYDAFGRVATLMEKVDATDHTTSYTYNNLNDVLTTTYPSGLVITNEYEVNGYLTKIKNGSTDLYTVTAMNGQDQVTNYLKGTKSSVTSYQWGFPVSYVTGDVQHYELSWDIQKGNLTTRNDLRATVNKTETFLYDNLNRLTSATVSGSTAFTATYASNGNIGSKTDAGTYSYHPTKFNATTGVTNPSPGGAQPSPIPLMQQDISYTAFMQPNVVTENGNELTYTYGADYERIMSVAKLNGTVINTRLYFAGGFEKDISGGTTRYVQYIASPTGLAAIVESVGGTHTVHYAYTDHLGSILTVTNSSGTVEAEQSFDAWGRRRDVTSWGLQLPTAPTGLPVWLYRGYTGHEHLDRFGLINMNGRMYDPVLGRMLSPDNYVQEPGMTQSYNRYTYAMNNPLVYTDPDGNFWFITPQIGFGKGGFSLGLEIGIGFKGIASISVSAGYNFKNDQGYWSAQGAAFGFYAGYGSSGWFAGVGYRHPGSGLGIGGGYSQAGGWNAGLGYGKSRGNFSGAAGIGWSQKAGFDWNIGGGYTHIFENPVRTKIAEYVLDGAPETALQQRGANDCLICATTYIDQMAGGGSRSYEDILFQYGNSYDPAAGTDTRGGLEKLYGKGSVTAVQKGNPATIGKEMLQGNPTILAKDRNHALVLTKVEIWTKQFANRLPKTYFNVHYMDPATSRFSIFRNYQWNDPTFTIKFRR